MGDRKNPASQAAPALRADVSTTDVARHAHVSIGTVSRVFNQHPSVAPELRRRVLLASRALRFVPRVPHRCVGIVAPRTGLAMGQASLMTCLICRELALRNYAAELIDI